MKDLLVLLGLIILIVIAHSWKNPERKFVRNTHKSVSPNQEFSELKETSPAENFARQAVFPISSERKKPAGSESNHGFKEIQTGKNCPLYFPVKYHFCPAAHSSIVRLKPVSRRDF